ncbi:MAG: hypothetical protein ACJA1L_001234, partial [Paracoccaceae bacterium]
PGARRAAPRGGGADRNDKTQAAVAVGGGHGDGSYDHDALQYQLSMCSVTAM